VQDALYPGGAREQETVKDETMPGELDHRESTWVGVTEQFSTPCSGKKQHSGIRRRSARPRESMAERGASTHGGGALLPYLQPVKSEFLLQKNIRDKRGMPNFEEWGDLVKKGKDSHDETSCASLFSAVERRGKAEGTERGGGTLRGKNLVFEPLFHAAKPSCVADWASTKE